MSTINNGYTSLAELKAYLTPRGQTITTDTTDDAVMEDMIERASRRVDILMGRTFYPRIETYYYDVPLTRELVFGDDLLAVITLTNGDGNTIASTEYYFKPANVYPKTSLFLEDVSTYYWQQGTSGSAERVISLLAYWGYHDRYSQRGWKSAGTLGAAMNDTTTLTFTMTAGHTLLTAGNQTLKIDNEILQTSGVSTNTVTAIARGDNGSTAATHTNGSTVYYWQHMEEITALTLEVARMMYRSRFGESVETNAITTPAGVIVTPRSLPAWAQEVIGRYKKR